MDLLAPLAPAEEAPVEDAPTADPLLAPLPAAEPSVDPLMGADENAVQVGEIAGATIRSSAEVDEVPGDKLEGTLHEVETATLASDGTVIKQKIQGTLTVNNPSAEIEFTTLTFCLTTQIQQTLAEIKSQLMNLKQVRTMSKYSVSDAQMLVCENPSTRTRLVTTSVHSTLHCLKRGRYCCSNHRS